MYEQIWITTLYIVLNNEYRMDYINDLFYILKKMYYK